jgi:hypothetical protein
LSSLIVDGRPARMRSRTRPGARPRSPVRKLRELESLGVTRFNIHLAHDEMDATLGA